MAYATIEEIESEFKSIDFGSANASVSDAEVTDFLDQADALIHSYLSDRYAIPITGTYSLLIIKQIEIDLVSSRVAKILQLKQVNISSLEELRQEILSGLGKKLALEMLEKLRDDQIKLPDAELVSARGIVTKYPVPFDFCPTFKRQVDQW